MPTHFHIRWASGALDWERFATCWEAESATNQLAYTNERYTIEEFDDDCPRCLKVMTPKRAEQAERKREIALSLHNPPRRSRLRP
jgi:hypothetical protein